MDILGKNYPKVGVGVIIIKGGKVLMGKRKNTHGDGTWSFLGGHLEFNESWEECAKRECWEEIGVKIGNLTFFAATNDIFKKENKHYITIYMKRQYLADEALVKEPNKFVEVGWFDLDNLPSPRFMPLDNLLKKSRLV